MTYDDLFSVKIMLPSEVLLDREFSLANLPGEKGVLGILKGHTSMIVNLVPGVISAHQGGRESKYYIHGGVAHIDNNSLVILTDFAIDLENKDALSIKDKIISLEQQLQDCNSQDSNYDLISSKISRYKSAMEFTE